MTEKRGQDPPRVLTPSRPEAAPSPIPPTAAPTTATLVVRVLAKTDRRGVPGAEVIVRGRGGAERLTAQALVKP